MLIGVIHPQTCEIGLAEFAETDSYQGRYRADGAIELLLSQSDEAPVVNGTPTGAKQRK